MWFKAAFLFGEAAVKFGFVGLFSGGVLPLLGQGSKGDAVPLG